MNRKGFISTTIIFSIFLLFIATIFLNLAKLNQRNILNENQMKVIKKSTLQSEYGNNLGSFAERILINNGGKKGIEGKGTPNFATPAEEDEGMYAAIDDYGTSYYFRGAVSNNWVKFGKQGTNDIYWRIIRINGDGSVRMIYSGITAPTSGTATTMTGSGTQYGTAAYHSAYNKAEYQGYTWTEGERRGTGPSGLKTAVDAWYKNQTNLEDNEHLLADAYFCNDRTFQYDTTTANWNSGIVGVGLPKSTQYNMAQRRLDSAKTPTLKCPNKLDAYTKSDTTYGNAGLTHPVGLITADEVSMAGGVYGTANSSYYLYTNQTYWMLSPCYVDPTIAVAFYVNPTGRLGYNGVDYLSGLRPAVSLTPDTHMVGSGTYDDVYQLPPPPTFAETILANNGGKKVIDLKSPPNFGTTTGDGVYAAEDDYTKDTGNLSYYFRGAVSNNWVKFGKQGTNDIYWRIIRINGDGSVRMIYSGITAPTSTTATKMTGSGTQLSSTSSFNSSYNAAEYQGYTYTLSQRRGTGNSTIKTAVDAWYKNQTNLQDNEHLLADAYFCNDRTFQYDTTTANWTSGIVGVGLPKSHQYNMGNVRLDIFKTPTLKCPNKLDAYTKSDTTYGNAGLTHPVGLITADEVSMAGGVWLTDNSSYYLYTNSEYWTLSPIAMYTTAASAFRMGSSGNLHNLGVGGSNGLRPAVSLIANTYVTGSGTYNDIYEVIN